MPDLWKSRRHGWKDSNRSHRWANLPSEPEKPPPCAPSEENRAKGGTVLGLCVPRAGGGDAVMPCHKAAKMFPGIPQGSSTNTPFLEAGIGQSIPHQVSTYLSLEGLGWEEAGLIVSNLCLSVPTS